MEYDPIDDQPLTKNIEKIEKLVLATHLPSPVLSVSLFKHAPQDGRESPRVDLIVSSGEDLFAQFPDFLQRGLSRHAPFCKQLSEQSDWNCVNAVACWRDDGTDHVVIGDLTNRVRVFRRADASGDAFEEEAVMGVNDCVYYVWRGAHDLVILTRQGVYIYSFSVCSKQLLQYTFSIHCKQLLQHTFSIHCKQLLQHTFSVCSKQLLQHSSVCNKHITERQSSPAPDCSPSFPRQSRSRPDTGPGIPTAGPGARR